MQEEEKIARLLELGELLAIEQLFSSVKVWTKNLVVLSCLVKVFHIEVENNVEFTVFDYSVKLDELSEHYIRIKLLLRRIEFDLPLQEQEELFTYCCEKQVSVYLLSFILMTNIFHKAKVCRKLIQLFEKEEGKESQRAQYFRQILPDLEDEEDE